MKRGRRYRVEFEALTDARPDAIRLRRMLKHALRSEKLRCHRIEEVEPSDTDKSYEAAAARLRAG